MQENEVMLQARDLNQQGNMLLKTGNIRAAKEKFERAIELEPMLMESYRNYAELFMLTGEYQEAKNYYKKALLIKKDGEVYFKYGNACFMNDEPHEGLEYYNRALSAGFDSDEMLFFMGMAYEHMNDDRMSLRYIQKAINKNPSRPDYKVRKVHVLLRLGFSDDAKAAAEELILNDPELYDGYHMKTVILNAEKKFEEAVEFSKMASEKFPEDADLFYDYAQSMALWGKYDETLAAIARAKKLKYYENAKQRFLLLEAEVNAEKGNIDAAIDRCLECINLEDERSAVLKDSARFMLINLYLTKPDFDNALVQASEIIKQDSQNSYYYAAMYFRPYCLRQLGRETEAVSYYNEAISLYRLATLTDAEMFEAYLYRAMCLKDIEQYDEALALLDFMEQLTDGEIAEVYTIRADIYELTDKKALAKQELEKAYQLKPQLKGILQEADKQI